MIEIVVVFLAHLNYWRLKTYNVLGVKREAEELQHKQAVKQGERMVLSFEENHSEVTSEPVWQLLSGWKYHHVRKAIKEISFSRRVFGDKQQEPYES